MKYKLDRSEQPQKQLTCITRRHGWIYAYVRVNLGK